MLAYFLSNVDNPQDVEDYILSYFKDNALTRAFSAAYVKRRAEHHAAGRQRLERDVRLFERFALTVTFSL